MSAWCGVSNPDRRFGFQTLPHSPHHHTAPQTHPQSYVEAMVIKEVDSRHIIAKDDACRLSTAEPKSTPTRCVSGSHHPSRLLAAKVTGPPPSHPQFWNPYLGRNEMTKTVLGPTRLTQLANVSAFERHRLLLLQRFGLRNENKRVRHET